MSYRTRIYYTDAQKDEMWERWSRGESLKSIGRYFDRGSSSIYNVLSRSGGIRPPERKRSRLALSLSEREEISRGLASTVSLRSIALQLNRAPSTISREVARNGGFDQYRANKAEHRAWNRAHRPKMCKLATHTSLCRRIANKLQLHWSPRQIAGWLKREYPGEESKYVSHETLYKSLFIQARGAPKEKASPAPNAQYADPNMPPKRSKA